MKNSPIFTKYDLPLPASYDFIVGLFLGLVLMFLFIFTLNLSGFVVLTGSVAELTHQIIYWFVNNLGWSTVIFSLVLVIYLYYLYALKKLLNTTEKVSLAEVEEKNHKLDKLVSIFFGVGVLWTAIGMRSALTAALGDLDSSTAATLGAWEILSRLVDGGILLALSTTIVGGAGGYLMSMIKQWNIDKQLSELYYQREQNSQDEIISRLDQMVVSLSSNKQPVSDTDELNNNVGY